MEVKELLDRNWSRKAGVAGATLATIVLLARTTDVDPAVLNMALVITGLIGVIGLVVQGVLDWRHPKAPPCFVASTWVNPGDADPADQVLEETRHPTETNASKAVHVGPVDAKPTIDR